jgi:hypothetical protein
MNTSEIIKTVCIFMPKVIAAKTITIEEISMPESWFIPRKIIH